MNIATILIAVAIVFFFSAVSIIVWAWMALFVGKTYWVFLKSRLPWNRGKSRILNEIDKSTLRSRFYLFTKVPDHDLIKIEKNRDPLKERLLYVPEVIHQTDDSGIPYYICLRDFDKQVVIMEHDLKAEMEELEKAITIINDVVLSKNAQVAEDVRIGVIRLLPKFLPKFKFLAKARVLIEDAIALDNNKVFQEYSTLKKLEYYFDKLVRIREVCIEKERTYVNAKDLYTDAETSKSNKQAIAYAQDDGYLRARMTMKNKNTIDVLILIAVGLVILISLFNLFQYGSMKGVVQGLQSQVSEMKYRVDNIYLYNVPTDVNGMALPFVYGVSNQNLNSLPNPTNVPNVNLDSNGNIIRS